MHWNQAFIRTLRQDPSEAELVSHRLMVRAGMIQKVSSGIYDYLPAGLRVIRKIEAIIREEMQAAGAVELLMPVVIPAQLWHESGRWEYYGPELLRFTDRKNNDFCLGPTHEEVIVDVVRSAARSYRDYPLCLYQIQTKFRDEIRPRYGLMRGREFIMKDAYSFHTCDESLDAYYREMSRAYERIFTRCGLVFRPVEADSGAIGGSVTHEFHVLADSGEDAIAYCSSCEYAANIERAQKRREPPAPSGTDSAPMVKKRTPGCTRVEDVASFLSVEPYRVIKTILYQVDGKELVAVCIRGDGEINEAKLRTVLGADQVMIPDEALVRAQLGVPVGYLGPRGLKERGIARVVADVGVEGAVDSVTGANEEGFHLVQVTVGRDAQIDLFADIGFVSAGEGCPRCSDGILALRKGIEVGQVFKLGRKYSEPMRLMYLDESGVQQHCTMGCYGIGVGRTAAAAIEQNHDAKGMVWPRALSPYTVTILCLDPGDPQVASVSLQLHDRLEQAGIDVLLDNRDERPGVKFNDADLLGCWVRVTVGARGLKENAVEVRLRRDGENIRVPLENAADYLYDLVTAPEPAVTR